MPTQRRRRTSTKTGSSVHGQLPPHVGLPEWKREEEWTNPDTGYTFKKHQPVLVTPITRKGSTYIFLHAVTPPDGHGSLFIEVLEQQRRAGKNGPKLTRAVAPSRVRPLPKKIQRRIDEKGLL